MQKFIGYDCTKLLELPKDELVDLLVKAWDEAYEEEGLSLADEQYCQYEEVPDPPSGSGGVRLDAMSEALKNVYSKSIIDQMNKPSPFYKQFGGT